MQETEQTATKQKEMDRVSDNEHMELKDRYSTDSLLRQRCWQR